MLGQIKHNLQPKGNITIKACGFLGFRLWFSAGKGAFVRLAKAKYTRQDKDYYLKLCHRYNKAKASIGMNQEFVLLSVELHVAKAHVPRSWRTAAFVESVSS